MPTFGKWRDISEAPKKDHFVAIVYCPDKRDNGGVIMGEYERKTTWSAGGWRIHIDGQHLDPTHFMFLPDPPNTDG